MKVVLLKPVYKLGAVGDVVDVKNGYARNHLLPQGFALFASKNNVVQFQELKEQLQKDAAEQQKIAKKTSETLRDAVIPVITRVGPTGQLYGAVTAKNVADVLLEHRNVDVPKRDVILDQPIKTIGLHPVKVRLHADVSANIVLNIARSFDEADAQKRGEPPALSQDDPALSQDDPALPQDADALPQDADASSQDADGEPNPPQNQNDQHSSETPRDNPKSDE